MGKVLGKSFQDREQSARVRNLALAEIENILTKKIKVDKEFRNALILKLAGAVLPRLNEFSGPEGRDLTIRFDELFKTSRQAKGNNTEQSEI